MTSSTAYRLLGIYESSKRFSNTINVTGMRQTGIGKTKYFLSSESFHEYRVLPKIYMMQLCWNPIIIKHIKLLLNFGIFMADLISTAASDVIAM